MPIPDLYLGVLLGALFAGILGFVLQRIYWSTSRMGAFFEPQRITVATGRSPAQILSGCLQGILALLFLLLFIALVVYLVGYFF